MFSGHHREDSGRSKDRPGANEEGVEVAGLDISVVGGKVLKALS